LTTKKSDRGGKTPHKREKAFELSKRGTSLKRNLKTGSIKIVLFRGGGLVKTKPAVCSQNTGRSPLEGSQSVGEWPGKEVKRKKG